MCAAIVQFEKDGLWAMVHVKVVKLMHLFVVLKL